MNKLVEEKNLMAFKHKGFWKCMDYLRDKMILDQMCKENKALWKR
jgi:glucose-1-phosphate cytidylyltransferase